MEDFTIGGNMNAWKKFLIDLGVSTLIVVLNNPELLPQAKPIALKIYQKIKEVYAFDPDFQ